MRRTDVTRSRQAEKPPIKRRWTYLCGWCKAYFDNWRAEPPRRDCAFCGRRQWVKV